MGGIWQTLPPMSQGRCEHVAAVVGERLNVCGGWSEGRLKSAECFDTSTNTWTSLPAMGHARDDAAAAVIRNHLYLVGGDLKGTSSERLLPTGNWQELPRMH